jgi:hypothetical protein
MKPEIKQQWVDALRSGEYKQGYGMLHPDSNTFCCLGVLCDLHRKESNGVWTKKEIGMIGEQFFYQDVRSYLPTGVCGWAGLDFTQMVYHGSDQSPLPYLNDVDKLDFEHIADLIEAQL